MARPRSPNGLSKKIASAISDAGEVGISTREIVEKVYADDPNGGPLGAEACVHSTITRMRKRDGFKVERITVYRRLSR